MTSHIHQQHQKPGAKIPMRKEAYTTYLYWGFALVFLILFIIGFTRV